MSWCSPTSTRGARSGAEVSADTATVWTIEAGKVVRLALYWESETALEVAGLRPAQG
jgi:ketosteroid isomerase-like protein